MQEVAGRDRAPSPDTILQVLETRAQLTPEAVALVSPARRPLTYAALLDQATRTSEHLRGAGIRARDRVAVVLPNGPEMAAAFLGVAAAASCAPLNPAYRAAEFDFYLSDLEAQALIIGSEMTSPARDVARQRGISIFELVATEREPAGEFRLRGENGDRHAHSTVALPEQTALILHTSGTTSRPKMVPLTHSNVCHSSRNVAATLALSDRDRCLNVMPLFHIHGLIAALLASLTAGGSVVCTPGFDAERFYTWLDTLEPSWYTAVPTMHQAVLNRAAAHTDVIARRRLRFIRSSSASLPVPVLSELERTFGAPVIEAYGMTEAAHQMASNPLPPGVRKPGSVGLPAGPEVAVMDADGNLLPAGGVGEVVIRGPNVTRGYENNAAANETSFREGWFRTGDQGYLDSDGFLTLTGRLKELINRGGEKIAPKEIDDVLLEHPAVGQAIALAVPHPTLGEDVAAALVLRPGVPFQERALLEFAATRLADFKVPRQLIVVDEIPKGATGKLQRIGLADKLASQLAAKRATNFVAAEADVDRQVSEIWARVLKDPRIGVRDSFFELGGDSLQLVTMLMEVKQQFGVEVSVDSFLNSPTVETISSMIRRDPGAGQQRTLQREDGDQLTLGVRDSAFRGLKNRLLQVVSLYAPGFKTTRVWLHRMRGVSIGRNVSIGLSVLIETAYPELVSIGDDVTIGMRTLIIGHLRDSTVEARRRRQRTVTIDNDVYVGPGVIILPNVTIGRGAVVSAGSVVSRSVPAHTLVRGNPAVPVAQCGVSLGGGVSYEEFVRNLRPLSDTAAPIGLAP